MSLAARREAVAELLGSKRRAARAVSRAEQAVVGPVAYVGLATRTLAIALDAAIINGTAILIAGIVSLALSILNPPDQMETVAVAIGGFAYVVWLVGYFVVFWSTKGQTPGSRVFHIRVCDARSGEPLLPRRSLVRFAGLMLAAIPLGAGFLPILFTDRRRGLQDWLAHTVVIESEDKPVLAPGHPRSAASA